MIMETGKTKIVEIEAQDEDDVNRFWKAEKDTPKYKGSDLKSTELV